MGNSKSITAVFERLNTDRHLSRMEPGMYASATGLVLYEGLDGKGGVARKYKGTKEIPWAAPAGDNTGIGTFWDERGDTMFVFVHNSLGDHCLIRHYPGEPTARTLRIPAMNLSKSHPVTGVAFVNGTTLVFTDGQDYVKYIDLDRADDTGKRSKVRLYFPKSDIIVDSRSFSVGVSQGGNTPPIFFTITVNSHDTWGFQPMFTEFAAQWNANGILRAGFEAHACAEWIELEAVNVGDYSVRCSMTDIVNGIPQPSIDCISEFTNRYNSPLTTEQVRLSTIRPGLPPTATLAYDNSSKPDNVSRRVMQFAYGYRFVDKRHSLTSPMSDIALPPTVQCQNSASSLFNCVDLTFGDRWLQDPAMRGEIEFIDLYVKFGNAGEWSLFKTMEKWEWIYTRSFRFHNDGAYTAADKLFVEAGQTFLPPVASALEFFTDSSDNHRLVLGNITEGDDNPCVPVKLKVRFDDTAQLERGTVRVHARVYISAPLNSTDPRYIIGQPIGVYGTEIVYGGMGGPPTFTGDPETWGQRLPLGGFVGYMAGTDLIGISNQVVASRQFPCGTCTVDLWPVPQGSPATGRNIYDLRQAGGPRATQCKERYRYACRNVIESPSTIAIYSDLYIDGLEPGKSYVLRMASNLCDSLGDDSLYDIMGAGRKYQSTDLNVCQVGSISIPGQVEPNPSGMECTVTVPLGASPGSTIEIGDIIVIDATNPNPLGSTFINSGNLFDMGGADHNTNGRDVRLFGATAEKQLVVSWPYSGGSPDQVGYSEPPTPFPVLDEILAGRSFTSHNGYWYFLQRTRINSHPHTAWLGVTGNPSAPSGSIGGFLPGSISVADFQICNDTNAPKWEGGLDTPTLTPISGNLHGSSGARQYIFANLNDSPTLRTHVRATLQTSSGNPIPGVSVVMQSGRVATTDAAGSLDLIAYGDVYANDNNRLNDRLIFHSNGPCSVSIGGGNIWSVAISQFVAGADYDEVHHKDIGMLVAIVSGIGNGRSWGRGSRHLVGYKVQRDNGDQTAVKPIGMLRIPLPGEDLHDYDPFEYPIPGTYSTGAAKVDFEIMGNVPDLWIGKAECLQFVATEDLARQWQLQWVAGEIVYSTEWNGSVPVPTQYSTGNATEVYIDVSTSLVRYFYKNSDSQVVGGDTNSSFGYLWAYGDRLRILSDRNGVYLKSVVDVPIVAQRGRQIVVKASAELPELFGGEVIEIYTPRLSQETDLVTYYELPNGIVTVNFSNPTQWSATTGTLEWGDSWMLPTLAEVQYSVPNGPWTSIRLARESKWMSDFFKSTSWGRGKPSFADPDAKTQHRPTLMRYSDSYKPGTSINGLNLFDGLSMRQAENALGPIMILCSIGNVILGVCKVGAFSVYKGVEQLENAPDSRIKVAGGILGQVRPFAHKLGTEDPLSFVRGKTNAFWFSRANGDVIQYSSNDLQGMGEIHGAKTYLMAKGARMDAGCNVCAGWDMVHGEFIFSFGDHKWDDGYESHLVPAEGIKFHDKRNAWTSKLEFAPQVWGRTRLRLFSMADGILWEHHVTTRYNETYGVTHPMRIAPVFVAGVNRIWKSLWIRPKGEGWECDIAWNEDGQETYMPSAMFKMQECYRTASMKRDVNDNNPRWATPEQRLNEGAEMRSPEIAASLSHDRNGYAELRGATITFEESPNAYPTQ